MNVSNGSADIVSRATDLLEHFQIVAGLHHVLWCHLELSACLGDVVLIAFHRSGCLV